MKAGSIHQRAAVGLVFGRKEDGGGENTMEALQAELRMADDIKKESSVSPRVSVLRPGWSAKRNAAENEGSGIVGELLLAVLAFLPDEGNSFELPESEP